MRHSQNGLWFLLGVILLAATVGCPPADSGTDGSGSEGTSPEASEGTSPATDGSQPAADLEGKIEIDGSSTVFPLSQAVAVDFMKKYPAVKVTVGKSGTGGGFKRFKEGKLDVSDASRPVKDSEFSDCKKNGVEFIEIPVAYDGLSIVVHSDNKFVKELTVDDLKKIFLAPGAKTWKEVNDEWPDETIKVYAPGQDSGTYDYFFGDVVNKDEKGQPRDENVTFSEEDNVLVDGVAREPYAIGFFGCSYYFANTERLRAVPIVDPATGTAVMPSAETIESGEYAPFSRPLFIYLSVKSLEKPAMKQFAEFYLSNASKMAPKVGYVALPEKIYEEAYSRYENNMPGTHYLTPEMEKRSGSLTKVYVEDNLVNVK